MVKGLLMRIIYFPTFSKKEIIKAEMQCFHSYNQLPHKTINSLILIHRRKII